jgi:SAM-dependent methyltransferase
MTNLISACPICGADFKKELDVKDHFLSQEKFEILCCPSCHLRKTSPTPSPESIGKYYDTKDYLSHGDDQKGVFAWLYRQAKKINLSRKARLLNQLAPHSHILDYGCGTGDFIQYCQELGFEVRGAEPSVQALTHASPLVIDNIVSPEKELASDTKYDVITMWHVLEHVHNPISVITRLKEKLNNDGRLIIAVPNPASADAKHYGPFWAGWDVPRHLWHFEPDAMIKMASSLGLGHETTQPMWFDAYYVSWLSERYKQGLTPLAAFWGSVSNLRALVAKKRRCSSQIYVFKAI